MKKLLFLAACVTFASVLPAAEAFWIGPSGGNLGDPENWDIGVVPANGTDVSFTNLTAATVLTNNLPEGRHFNRFKNMTEHGITVVGEDTFHINFGSQSIYADKGDIVMDVPVNFVNSGSIECGVRVGAGKRLVFNRKVTFTRPEAASVWNFSVASVNGTGTAIFNSDVEGPVNFYTGGNLRLQCLGALNVDSVELGPYMTSCNLTLPDGVVHACPLWKIGSTSTLEIPGAGLLPENAVLVFEDAKYIASAYEGDWTTGVLRFSGDTAIDHIVATNSPVRLSGPRQGKYQNITRLEGSGTITLKSSRSFSSYAAWNGNLSMVYDPQGDFTFGFCTRTNSMTGTITVKGGALALEDGVSFPNVTEVSVEGGSLSCDCPVWGTPFSASVSFRMNDGAGLSLSAGTAITAGYAFCGGLYLPRGTYTGTGYGSEGVTETDWITGPGTLTVTADTTCWIGESGGSWSDPANWTDGLPESGREAYFISGSGDFEIAVPDDAVMPEKLFVCGTGGATVTLSGSMTFEKTWIEIAAGGRIVIPEGKKFLYTGVDGSGERTVPASDTCTDANSVIYIHDGGELLIDGGDAEIMMLAGFVRLGGSDQAPGMITVKGGSFGVHAADTKDKVFLEDGGRIEMSEDAVYTGGDLSLFMGSGDGKVSFGPGVTADPVFSAWMYSKGSTTFELFSPVKGNSQWNETVVFGFNAVGTADTVYMLSNTCVTAGRDNLTVAGPVVGYGHKATDLRISVDALEGTALSVSGHGSGGYMPAGVMVGYGAHSGYADAAPPRIEGELNIDDGAVLTNFYGHFMIGCGWATGRVCICGGEVVSGFVSGNGQYDGTAKTFAIGMWHGSGELEISGGCLDVRSDAYIGGRVRSEFAESAKWEHFKNTSFGYHDAQGRLVHSGGDVAFTKNLILAADGTGIVECRGSAGSFTTGGLILSNSVDNADSGATLKFVFDENGVCPVVSTGPLVIGENAKLVIDTSAYPADGRGVTVLRSAGCEGVFSDVELTGAFADKAVLQYGGTYIRLAIPKGLALTIR